jgi:ketosteroid isomerase-like protein
MSNKEILRGVYAAFSRGDIEAVLAAMTEDVAWDAPGGEPYSGRRIGRGQVQQFFTELDRQVQLDEFDADEFLEDGNKVVVLGRERATVRDSGLHFESAFAHVFTLRNGKIAEVRLFADTHAAASAFASARERQALGGPLGTT